MMVAFFLAVKNVRIIRQNYEFAGRDIRYNRYCK